MSRNYWNRLRDVIIKIWNKLNNQKQNYEKFRTK
jgi:hypothetical protein